MFRYIGAYIANLLNITFPLFNILFKTHQLFIDNFDNRTHKMLKPHAILLVVAAAFHNTQLVHAAYRQFHYILHKALVIKIL